MAPRRYEMERRAEAARETRDRIVRATMELHAEKGVVATSHKDIAARADVSVGTVYHHFPTQDDVVRACGACIRELIPSPPLDAIDARASRPARIATLAHELVGLFARMPWLETVRAERHEVPALDTGIRLREESIRAFIRRALGRSANRKRITVIEAIIDPAVVNRLLQSGLSPDEAAATLASIINAWLQGGRS